MLLLLVAVSAAFADSPIDSPYDAHDLEVLSDFRLAELGIEIVEEDDGESYHYSLPPDLDTPDVIQRGPLFYDYDGQETFSPMSGPASGDVTVTHPDWVLTDISFDPDGYLGVGDTVRVDAYGRRWLLSGFDDAALWSAMDDYDALVASTFGEEAGQRERDGIEAGSLSGITETSTLDTDLWVGFDCEGDSAYETVDHISGGTTDGLSLAGSLNVREKKTVLIMGVTNPTGYAYLCSGVMVDDTIVLTAAHCIGNATGYTDQANLRVCSFGNVESGAQCRSVSSLTLPGGVSTGDVEDDYGLIELSSAFSPGIGWMAISAADDTTLAAATHFVQGFPGWRPTCAGNFTNNDADTVQDGHYLGYNHYTSSFQYYDYLGGWEMTAYGPAKSVESASIYFNVSAGHGMSGGPYYYCPSGCTDTSGTHYITSIVHAHHLNSNTDGYSDGPKASSFRDWVIANM